MAVFWGESPEDQARYNLRFALWNIRKVFKENDDDPDPLLSTRNVCSLNPEIHYNVDSRTFDAAIAAAIVNPRITILQPILDIYRGPFLNGFTLRNLSEWEDWLFHRRETLHQKFLSASIALGNQALRSAQTDFAGDVFLRTLAYAPDLDQAHEGLIRAYADSGRTSAALRQFNTYVQIMKREFNAPPATAIARLVEELRNGSYVPTAPEPVELVLAETTDSLQSNSVSAETIPEVFSAHENLQPPTESTPDTPFIGRTQELRDLQALITEVVSGQGQVLIVSGEMGIGKTRLFSEFLKMLPSEFIVGVGESREIESTRPLEDIMQVLESVGRDPRLTPQACADLKSLFELQQKVIEQQEGVGEPQLLEGIRRWIVSIASRQPILIALDDMHWAGEPLHKIFSTLAQEVKRLPLLLVGIFRTFEEQSEETVGSALISIARTGRLRRIELGSLSYENTIEIIRRRAAEIAKSLTEQELQRIFQYSSGIPLYAVELANSLLEGQTDFIRSPALIDQPDFTPTAERKLVPQLMLKITSFRLSQLPVDYVKLLKTASLILGDFSLGLAGRFSGLEQDPLEEMLVDLESRNMMHSLDRSGRLSFGFNHQMTKLAIAETIPILERQRLFREIVRVFREANEPTSSDALAYYLYNSGDRVAALDPLMASAKFWFVLGDRSAGLRYARVAYEIASERLDEEPDRMLDVILKHCDYLIELGLIKSAIDVLTTTLDRISARPDDRSSLLTRRAELTQLLKTDPNKPPAARKPLAIVTAKRALADVKLLQGDLVGSAKLIEEVETALEELPGSDETLRSTGLLFQVKSKLLIQQGETARAIPLLESAAELLRQQGTGAELAESYRLMGRAYRLEREFEKAADALDNCYLMVQGVEATSEMVEYLHEVGLLMFDQDRFLEAEDFLSRALDVSRSRGEITAQLPTLLTDYARILTQRGDKEKARQMTKQAEETSQHLSRWGDILRDSGSS